MFQLHSRVRIKRGQTFPEMMIVVAIIAILAAVIMANLFHARNQAQVSSVVSTMQNISNALEMYNNDYGVYPGADATVAPAMFGGDGNPYYNGANSGNGIKGNRQYSYYPPTDCSPTPCNFALKDSCTFDGGNIPSWITDLGGNPGVKGTGYAILYTSPKGFWITAQPGACPGDNPDS